MRSRPTIAAAWPSVTAAWVLSMLPGVTPPVRVIDAEVTAYCACELCCGPDAIGVTASGKGVEYDNGMFVAADTAVLPFGTMVSIPGYHDGRPVEVIDRGGAIKGTRIDVFFADHDEAIRWGRQSLRVKVLPAGVASGSVAGR